MCLKSMVEYMKEVFRSICWKGFGSRLRLLQSSIDDDDDSKQKQSCLANILPELLQDVVMRMEATETDWSPRNFVTFCAGVCQNWRRNMKEIVKCPQLSDKLTFPVSLIQPGSMRALTRCLIESDIDTGIYVLYVNPRPAPYVEGKFLLAAKRVSCATCTEYIISINFKDISKWSSSCVGILRSNFLGTKFRVYDADNYPVSSISYQVNALGNRGSRQMLCEMSRIPAKQNSLPSLFKLKDVKLVLLKKFKRLRWPSKLWCWWLNFIGYETFEFVKNFELVACLDNEVGVKVRENIILNFKTVDDELFTMDYQYPLSAFQAFAIALSSFDTKVANLLTRKAMEIAKEKRQIIIREICLYNVEFETTKAYDDSSAIVLFIDHIYYKKISDVQKVGVGAFEGSSPGSQIELLVGGGRGVINSGDDDGACSSGGGGTSRFGGADIC